MSENTSKSVLDDVPVVNSAFKSFPDYTAEKAPSFIVGQPNLFVVAHCPKCGSPIYGPKEVGAGIAVQVQRTCVCVPVCNHDMVKRPLGQQKELKDHMRTS